MKTEPIRCARNALIGAATLLAVGVPVLVGGVAAASWGAWEVLE